MSHIHKLIESGKTVILDCCLENGAIVAGNADKDYYPSEVQNYRFVWPRDAAFTLYAAHLLNLKEVNKKWVNWLLNRCEDFSKSGVLYQRYATNGRRDPFFGWQFQPDQAGAQLWALLETNENPDDELKKVIHLLADGICSNWEKTHFRLPTHDLWEERQTVPQLEDNFLYSLAACSFGLHLAYELLGKKDWQDVSDEMDKLLNCSGINYFPRLCGQLPDTRIDASVLGLIWPFRAARDQSILRESLRIVARQLLTPQGVHRYEHDEYCGNFEHMRNWKKGAGGWPLLMFWYIIALSRLGNKEEAKTIFENYCQKFSRFLPEQVFDNNIQKSISPLCWSHSMQIIAAHELGYF